MIGVSKLRLATRVLDVAVTPARTAGTHAESTGLIWKTVAVSHLSTLVEWGNKFMANGRYIAYLRVSTVRQGRSGLGLDAQRESIRLFVAGRGGRLVSPEYVEIETGRMNQRPQLSRALARCRATGATLVVAKLDRLSRNASFLLALRDARVDFVAADLPEVNTMTLGIMALVAQHEAEMISKRTKEALRAAKARGKVLGGKRPGAADIRKFQRMGTESAQASLTASLRDAEPEIRHHYSVGVSLNELARRLNRAEVRALRGGKWTAKSVGRVVAKLGMRK